MRRDGIPKVCLSLSILGLTVLSANMTVTRLTPDAHVYQVQLLGRIMLVCPETFGRSSASIDCERWLRRTRGGSTVFVQPTLPPEPGASVEDLGTETPLVATSRDIGNVETLSSRIRPKPRPTY